MLEQINEPISILVNFGNNKIMPLFFLWRKKRYKIEKLNLVHKKRDGGSMIYYFNVSDKVNYFKLSFATKDLSWRIEELYCE